MELFFQPMACSLATRIAFYEAGIPVDYIRVNLKEKKTADGRDFLSINARGQVPALRLPDGDVLTENVAVLDYVADLKPEAALALRGKERLQVRRWIGLINSELHTGALEPVLSTSAPAPVEAKAYLLGRARQVLAYIDGELRNREWLAGQYSVADMYLAVVVSWLQSPVLRQAADTIAPTDYPNLQSHNARVFTRPAAAKALREELALFRAG